MAAFYNEDDYPPVIRSARRILRTFGLISSVDKKDSKDPMNTSLHVWNKHSDQELGGFAKQLYNGPDYRDATHSDTMAFVSEVVTNSLNIIRDLKSLYKLNPELKQIERILVSSIMSPNDMQTDAVNISVEAKMFKDVTNTKLSDLFSNYFNDEFEIGTLLTDWIGNALVRYGSQPVFVLPRSNVRALDILQRYNRDGMPTPVRSPNQGTELNKSLMMSTEDQKKLNELKQFTGVTEDLIFTIEGFELKSDPIAMTWSIECQEAISNKSSINLEHLVAQNKGATNKSNNLSQYTTDDALIEVFEDAKLTLRHIESVLYPTTEAEKSTSGKDRPKSTIKITTDLEKIKDAKQELTSRANYITDLMGRYFLQGNDSATKTFVGNDADQEATKYDRPSIVEFPAESVIPVHVPGSVSDHIGYFVLIDANGCPINASDCTYLMSQRSLTDLTKEATYGVPNVIYRSSGYGATQRFDAASAVFGTTIKRMMEKQLGRFGLHGAQVEHRESIMNCLFFNYMQKQEVQLVFVPESLMVYYRYDHRDDGTGKSILEDVFFILALRSTLLTAKAMAAIRNATDKTHISFDATKDTNILQTIDQLKELYVSKQTTNISVDPSSIMHDIVNKSIWFEPKNIMGLENFTVTVEHGGENHVAPDDGLIDKLTDMAITGTGVPPAALNQLGETEYAASIVTMNLFFANLIRCKQKVTNKHTTKMIRQIFRFDQYLQKQVEQILLECGETSVFVDQGKSQQVVIGNDEPLNKNEQAPKLDRVKAMMTVLANMKASLPTPNISTNRAHAKEILEFEQAMKSMLEGLYPDELIPQGAPAQAKEALTSVRALVKKNLMRDFIETIGFQGATDIPHLVDIDTNDLAKTTIQLTNISRSVSDAVTALNLNREEQ